MPEIRSVKSPEGVTPLYKVLEAQIFNYLTYCPKYSKELSRFAIDAYMGGWIAAVTLMDKSFRQKEISDLMSLLFETKTMKDLGMKKEDYPDTLPVKDYKSVKKDM